MSDVEDDLDTQEQDATFEERSHQACYIFTPFAVDPEDRPKKRRKTTHNTSQETHERLPILCRGIETKQAAQIRNETLRHVWNRKQRHIDDAVSQLDESALKDITAYVRSDNHGGLEDKLHTALIISGPDTTVQARLLAQWKSQQPSAHSEIITSIRSTACPNLQTALKHIIKNTITECVGHDGYHEFLAEQKRLLPMSFDLELLQIFVEQQGLSKVVVYMLDVETFETGILSELLSSLAQWTGRIPFVALLGIATTINLFESRLSRSIVRLLHVTIFTLTPPNDLLHKVFYDIQTGKDTRLFFGSSTLLALHELSQFQSTTIDSFTHILKFAYMSHFFANPLSVLLSETSIKPAEAGGLCEAIRNTDSFQQECESLLAKGKSSIPKIRALLEDDEHLLSTAYAAIKDGQTRYRTTSEIVAAIKDLRLQLGFKNDSSFLIDSQVYASIGDLTAAAVFEEAMATLEKLESSHLLRLLISLNHASIEVLGLSPYSGELQRLHEKYDTTSIEPSADSSVSKISSSKKLQTLTKTAGKSASKEASYTTILSAITEHITSITRTYSFDLNTTFLHEAFIHNSRQPTQNSFTPRPRFALERALGQPGDYLSCDCCSNSHNTEQDGMNNDKSKSGTAPPTPILYTLLQEAGTIINVRDLFDAFCSRLFPGTAHTTNGNDQDQDEEDNDNNINDDKDGDQNDPTKIKQRIALSLFYRSLSELKMLGMVKSSTSAVTKKRALALNGGDEDGGGGGRLGAGRRGYTDIDFVAKTSWGGL